jgi:gliding motility-associated-like protein
MKKTLSVLVLLLAVVFFTNAQPPCNIKGDFSISRNPCAPYDVSFSSNVSGQNNIRWSFGDASSASGNTSITHTYSSTGNYLVKLITDYPSCADTVLKTITLDILADNQLIGTPDTAICFGNTKQLRSNPGFRFCWSPATGLDNPASANPVSSVTQNTTYYLNSYSTGTNLITNGNFSAGNTGFQSEYLYNPSSGFDPGVYTVTSNLPAWHPSMPACGDHSSGYGNMMVVNGAEIPNVKVWSQTVAVQPNTNYAFSTWLQHVTSVNPAMLQFSINNTIIGPVFIANNTACIWDQFYTIWNSGNNTSASIAIVNQNQVYTGNDFALDDISFAPFIFKQDSVKITVDKSATVSSGNESVCPGKSVQLNATGAVNYIWTPASGLSSTSIPNPFASPVITTEYYVTGTSTNNCTAKDTVLVTVNPLPNVIASKSNDIGCASDKSTLNATGAQSYSWTPANNLSNPLIANPVASPADTTKYIVTGTDVHGCVNKDSVTINVTKTGQSLYLMPTAFTPNGDGINDCYGIRYWGAIQQLDFSIYNRWGERIFHTKSPSECWNGIYKGVKQDSGVFVYVVKAVTNCGIANRKGTLALIR